MGVEEEEGQLHKRTEQTRSKEVPFRATFDDAYDLSLWQTCSNVVIPTDF